MANKTALLLAGLPIGALAGYISWLVVPAVVMNVVPEVIKAIFGAR